MKTSKKGGIVLFLLAISIFGYSQYASASHIGVDIAQSELLDKTDSGSKYSVELQFENPSLLTLAAGQTEFFIMAGDKIVGKGELEPFILQPLDNSYASGIFYTDTEADRSQSIKINGITKYDVFFTSIDVPFVFYPTDKQAREFIHQG